MPAISVVIPVYNVQEYLQSCVDSCVAQTMKDIEFIFVNDASPDRSPEILRENEARYPGLIRVIDSPENRRQGGARNLGIRAAAGEYIGFVDSDDMILPDMFERLYQQIEKTGADVCYIRNSRVAHDVSYVRAMEKNWQAEQPEPLWSEKSLSLDGKALTDPDREWLLSHSSGHLWNALWRRSLLEEAGVDFPEHLSYEDNYWASLVLSYIRSITFVPRIGYLYRINLVSTTRGKSQASQLDRITIERSLLPEVKKRGLLERYPAAWEYIYTFRYAFNSFSIYASRFDDPPYDAICGVMRDLNTCFPRWRKNKYYRQQTPAKKRVWHDFIARFPRTAARLVNARTRASRSRTPRG